MKFTSLWHQLEDLYNLKDFITQPDRIAWLGLLFLVQDHSGMVLAHDHIANFKDWHGAPV
jgi:hypothetical protein